MQQLTTVKQKYVPKMTNPSTPTPTFKNVGDCSPNPPTPLVLKVTLSSYIPQGNDLQAACHRSQVLTLNSSVRSDRNLHLCRGYR